MCLLYVLLFFVFFQIQENCLQGTLYRKDGILFAVRQYNAEIYTEDGNSFWFIHDKAYPPIYDFPAGTTTNKSFRVVVVTDKELEEKAAEIKNKHEKEAIVNSKQYYIGNIKDSQPKIRGLLKKLLKKYDQWGWLEIMEDDDGNVETIANFRYECYACGSTKRQQFDEINKNINGIDVVQVYCLKCSPEQ